MSDVEMEDIPRKGLTVPNNISIPIPLKEQKADSGSIIDKVSEPERADVVSFLCRVNPTTPDGEKYKKYIPVFETGKPEVLLQLFISIEEVWRQNQVTTAANKYYTLKTALKGNALQIVETSIGNNNITNSCLEAAINDLKQEVFCHQALQIQRHYMRRDVKKPMSLTTRQFFNRFQTLNDYLPCFPNGNEDSSFSEMELREILSYALPKKWRDKFNELGFDAYAEDTTLAMLMEKAEAVERANPPVLAPKKPIKKKAHKTSKSTKSYKGKSQTTGQKKYYCVIHGHNNTHDSDHCKSLKHILEKEGVKTGNKNANDKKKYQEVNTLMGKMSSKGQKIATALVKKVLKSNPEEVNMMDEEVEINFTPLLNESQEDNEACKGKETKEALQEAHLGR